MSVRLSPASPRQACCYQVPREKAWLSVLATIVSLASVCSLRAETELIRFSRQSLTNTYFSEGIAVGDLDGDDVQDVVYGPYWFKGPDYREKHEIYPAQPQPMEGYADHFFAWVYDFDGNGEQDILTAGFPGTPAYVYENPGKGRGKWTKHQVFDWVSNESPQFVDLVGDDRPELVCTRDGFFGFVTVNWKEPFGTWTFHPITERVTADRFGHGLGVGDINGDGRQDILHAGGWLEQPENNALNGRWRPHAVAFSKGYGGAEMYCYDVDGDGDGDVITSEAAHDFGLSWYEQLPGDGEPTFQQHVILGDHPADNQYGILFSELHSVSLADMDGDGLKDIVTGKTYYSHHRQSPMWDAGPVVYWFKLSQSPEGVDWLPYQIDDAAGIGRQLTVTDINGDGMLDVATGGMLGAHVLLQTRTEVTDDEFLAAQPKPFTGKKPKLVESAVAQRGPRATLNGEGRAAGAIEGEELKAAVTGGTAAPQPMGGFPADVWSGNSQLWWTGGKPGDQLTIELDVFQDVESVELVMTCARDYGFVQVSLDEQPISEPLDLYDPEVITTGVIELKTPGLAKGKHQLTFELVGANAKAAKAYMFGLDFLRFRSPGEPSLEQAEDGIVPVAADGHTLNLDFETGTLDDWQVEGEAFAQQPVEGDTVQARRTDSRSRHQGKFWVGGYERQGDEPVGSLTSSPFTMSTPYASFYVGGGNTDETRVELWGVGDEKPFYRISGRQVEDLSRVIVDTSRLKGKQVFIKLIDNSRNGWGHLNFDHFRLHQESPGPVTPAAISLVPDEYPYGGLAAEEAAKVMRVPEGFRVTVCASEPDVKQPIAMTLDDRGRTWIAEAYEYPQRAEGDSGKDRILIFEDTNGDGKFDSRKVFAEGLNLVSGLEVGFGGVWIGAAPYLMFIPDANGDDRPDGPPQILLDGWGYEDTHETLNAFCWGPDGWLYGCHGVFTHSRVGKPGTPDEGRQPLNAGVWRYHPVRHQFEVFAHGTSNPWGVDFNEHGEAFVTACVIPHLYHMIPGARYQRQAGQHFNPYTYADIPTIADHLHYLGANPHAANGKSDSAGGGHAHAGAMFYFGGAWPDQYRGALFMNNIHGQRLNTDLLEPAGSGYVGKHGPDFLLTGDQASQILNMRYGPDGQVLFIDWYDMQACHRTQVEVHDRSNGRIYKVSYGKSDPIKVNLATSSDLELAENALNGNDWFVRHSRRQLQERASQRKIDATAIRKLEEIALTHADETRRLRAIWARHAIGSFDAKFLTKLQADASPHVRGWAWRLAFEQQTGRFSQEQLQQVAIAAEKDPSPVVRRAITSIVDKLTLADRWLILSKLVAHAEDASDHNLPLMYWYAMEPLADEDPDRALALGLSAGQIHPTLREFMLRRVAGSGGEEAIDRLVAALGKTDAVDIQLTFLNAIQAALAGQRQVAMPEQWSSIAARLNKGNDTQVKSLVLSLGVRFGDESALKVMRERFESNAVDVAERAAALETLLAVNDPQLANALVRSIPSLPNGELRLATIRGLAQYESPAGTKALLDHYNQGLDEDERRAAIAVMCSRAASAKALLTAIGDGKIPAVDLTADLARQVEYLGDASVNELLLKNWGQVRKTSAEQAQIIANMKQLVAREDLPPADMALGRAVFAKTCQRCHVLYGIGEQLGPDLTGSNRANLDYLLENIVEPSAVMANEYRQSIFLTDSGQVITGIVREENDRAVTIQTAESVVVLPKEEIEERKASELSMMPENQLSQFSEHEVRSLLAYLRDKQQQPMLATVDNASAIFNGKDLKGWRGEEDLWSVEDGELVGKSSGLSENEFLVSEMLTGDFRLTFQVRLVGNEGNSGVQFRSAARDDASVEGYQADIGAGWWGKLYEEHGRGLLWDKSGEPFVRADEWNDYVIEATGSKIRTWINGQLCVDLDDAEGSERGIFALQLHSGGPTEVRFRNLKLEVLSETNPSR